MAVFTIPTDTVNPVVEYPITIGGTPLVLRTRYNQRFDRYYLDFLSETGVMLRSGVKVMCNSQMLRGEEFLNILPEGFELWPMTLNPDVTPPGLGEFGENERVELTLFDGS